MKLQLICLALIVLFESFGLLLCYAEKNYNQAIFEAIQSEGTDAAIEEAMLKHGFNIDANDLKEPSYFTKIKAIF